jgi:hypothetical protein
MSIKKPIASAAACERLRIKQYREIYMYENHAEL